MDGEIKYFPFLTFDKIPNMNVPTIFCIKQPVPKYLLVGDEDNVVVAAIVMNIRIKMPQQANKYIEKYV